MTNQKTISNGSEAPIQQELSDGELDEGSNWEAILFAGAHRLAPLTAIVDYNKIQSFGSVAEVMDLEPLAVRIAEILEGP